MNINNNFLNKISNASTQLKKPDNILKLGKVTKISGLIIEATGIDAAIGVICEIIISEDHRIKVQVIGFSDNITYLMPIDFLEGLFPGAKVSSINKPLEVGVGTGLLGRTIDGTGNPIDGLGPISFVEKRSINFKPINPLLRRTIDTPLDVGIKSINSLITVGKGQRLGLFAGSGVGKSVLIGMMTKYTTADIVVIALIGERGREVKHFIEKSLGSEGKKKSIVIACPSDSPPVQRINGAEIACAISEYFRDQGKDVLLIMDSLSRYAQAQRQIALSLGEPPATKGYPPSVFAKLPNLIERAGNGITDTGSITAFYTVLAEGDDNQDPIVDSARSFLDGHIVLSRSIAEKGRYPAIDIEASISRIMVDIVTTKHKELANKLRYYYSLYQENSDLIMVGAYEKGANKDLDIAIENITKIYKFLEQNINEKYDYNSSISLLEHLFNS